MSEEEISIPEELQEDAPAKRARNFVPPPEPPEGNRTPLHELNAAAVKVQQERATAIADAVEMINEVLAELPVGVTRQQVIGKLR